MIRSNQIDGEKGGTKLLGTVFTSAAIASVASLALTSLMGASLLTGILIYSVIGASAMIALSWRRFLQSELDEENGQWVGSTAHHGYASLTVDRRAR